MSRILQNKKDVITDGNERPVHTYLMLLTQRTAMSILSTSQIIYCKLFTKFKGLSMIFFHVMEELEIMDVDKSLQAEHHVYS